MILISFCFDVQKIVSRASNVWMKFIFLELASVSPQLKTKQKYITPTWSNLIQLICPVYSQALFLGQWDSLSRGGTQKMVFNDHFSRKRYPFRIPSIDKWYPFHISCLELCIPFNCCKCTIFLTGINHKNKTLSRLFKGIKFIYSAFWALSHKKYTSLVKSLPFRIPEA